MTEFDAPPYKPSAWGAEFHARKENEVFGAGAAGPGKALALDTLIPTPTGLVRMKDVHTGDTVFGQFGEPVKVLAETEPMVGRKCCRLRFERETVVTDLDHEWIVTAGGKPIKSKSFVLPETRRYRIPFPFACELAEQELKVHPWLVGFLLAAGQPGDPYRVEGWDEKILRAIEKRGGKYHFLDAGWVRVKGVWESGFSDPELHVPERYLMGSIEQRKHLLRGFLDGCTGQQKYLPTKSRLYGDLVRLCGSLGYLLCARVDRKSRDESIIQFVIRDKEFLRTLHRPRHVLMRLDQANGFRFGSFDTCDSVPVKCIQVEGSIYLATRAHIPTHNSTVLLADPMEQIWTEQLRCQQSDIPESFSPELRSKIESHPLNWGHSQGWVIHLRRTMPRLSETIVRAHRLFKSIDKAVDWNAKDSTFTFSSGLRFEFGHCKDRDDYNNYLGKSYTHIGYDELVEFHKDQYDFINSRLRSSDPVLQGMLKIRAMSNPRLSRGKGTDISVDDPAWVKRYFVDPAPEGRKVIRRKLKKADGSVDYVSRIYLPATLYDNPDKEFVRQYETQLMARPKHIRDCYLYGRWDLVIGSFLDEIWNPEIHVCKPFRIPSSWPIFRAMDWGFRSNGIIGWYAQDPQGTLFKFYEVVFKEKTATWVAEKIVKPFEEKNKLWDSGLGSRITGPADTQIWEERGESAKTKYLEFADAGVPWMQADKRSREVNAEVLVSRLRDHENYTKVPGIVFFENCKTSVQTLPGMETDRNNLEVPKKGGWDHAWDETTYACQWAKQEGLDAPKYKPSFVDSLEDAEEVIDHGKNDSGFGYWM